MSKTTLVLDSTQISQFLTCPTMWKLHNLELLELNGFGKSAMDMGTYGHSLLEHYYKLVAGGIDETGARDAALKGPEPVDKLSSIEIGTVRKTFMYYCERYKGCDFQPSSPDSVEVGFSYKLFEDENRLYLLEGKMDGHSFGPSVGMFDNQRMFIDHKFQLRAHQLYNKRIQFRNYALATNSLYGMINYIRFHKNPTEDTFVREVIPFSRQELELWREKLIRVYDRLAENVNKGMFPQNWASCEGYYGRPCQYTLICEQDIPMVQENVKQMRYHQIEKWRPW